MSGLPEFHLSGNPFIAIIDTETSGFSWNYHDMISLSCEIRDFSYDLKNEITLYSAPRSKKRWSNGAEKIHGFCYEEAASFPDPRTTAIDFLKFLKPFKHERNRPILFVSHDTNGFDYRFIEWHYRMEEIHFSLWKVFQQEFKLSTIRMAEKVGFKTNKLNNWSERLGFELDHHEVKSDRIACSKIFEHLVRKYSDELAVDKKARNDMQKAF